MVLLGCNTFAGRTWTITCFCLPLRFKRSDKFIIGNGYHNSKDAILHLLLSRFTITIIVIAERMRRKKVPGEFFIACWLSFEESVRCCDDQFGRNLSRLSSIFIYYYSSVSISMECYSIKFIFIATVPDHFPFRWSIYVGDEEERNQIRKLWEDQFFNRKSQFLIDQLWIILYLFNSVTKSC